MLRKIKLSNLKTSSIMPKKVAKDWISLSTGARACQSYLIWTHEGVVRALEVVAVAMVAEVAEAVTEEAVELHTAVEAEEEIEAGMVEAEANHVSKEIKMPQCLWEISPTILVRMTSKRSLDPRASTP